jgi:probable F420-dependent oxidoreductase
VQFGVTMFATDQTIGMAEFARAVEDRGLYSLYLPEHTHIPTSRLTPPPTGDAELADEYKHTLDPFVALGIASAVTERLVVGTGICLVAQREPIVTAKAIATLDQQSGGRFVLGMGFGWNADEAEHHGVAMATRRERAREHLLAMRALWREEAGEYHGKFVEFSPSWSWPKPATPNGPPVLIGGAAGPKLFAAVAEYADGWIPIGGAGIREALPALHAACDANGRDPQTLRIVPFGTVPNPGKIEYYASLGIEEIVLRVPSAGADRVLPLLDRYAELVGG